jgi:hypothetical protein
MAFTAELTIEGKSFPILKCEYHFSQEVNLFGKPIPRVISKPIRLELMGSNDETNISWATNSQKKLDGTISFYKSNKSVFKEIKFENGYCIKYKEDIHPLKGSKSVPDYVVSMEISAKTISIGDIKHDNHWSL